MKGISACSLWFVLYVLAKPTNSEPELAYTSELLEGKGCYWKILEDGKTGAY